MPLQSEINVKINAFIDALDFNRESVAIHGKKYTNTIHELEKFLEQEGIRPDHSEESALLYGLLGIWYAYHLRDRHLAISHLRKYREALDIDSMEYANACLDEAYADIINESYDNWMLLVEAKSIYHTHFNQMEDAVTMNYAEIGIARSLQLLSIIKQRRGENEQAREDLYAARKIYLRFGLACEEIQYWLAVLYAKEGKLQAAHVMLQACNVVTEHISSPFTFMVAQSLAEVKMALAKSTGDFYLRLEAKHNLISLYDKQCDYYNLCPPIGNLDTARTYQLMGDNSNSNYQFELALSALMKALMLRLEAQQSPNHPQVKKVLDEIRFSLAASKCHDSMQYQKLTDLNIKHNLNLQIPVSACANHPIYERNAAVLFSADKSKPINLLAAPVPRAGLL